MNGFSCIDARVWFKVNCSGNYETRPEINMVTVNKRKSAWIKKSAAWTQYQPCAGMSHTGLLLTLKVYLEATGMQT